MFQLFPASFCLMSSVVQDELLRKQQHFVTVYLSFLYGFTVIYYNFFCFFNDCFIHFGWVLEQADLSCLVVNRWAIGIICL